MSDTFTSRKFFSTFQMQGFSVALGGSLVSVRPAHGEAGGTGDQSPGPGSHCKADGEGAQFHRGP